MNANQEQETLPSFKIPSNQTLQDRQYYSEITHYFTHSLGTDFEKLSNFTKYVPRAEISKFLAKNAIFQHILNIHGAIVECGVYLGGGLMTWAQISSIYEPLNHTRRVLGFDTFKGFPEVRAIDQKNNTEFAIQGGFAAPAYEDLQECLRLYDLGRPIGHIPRVELIAGDACQTIPAYVRDNPHLIVALLYLDFDLYEPTKIALETFLPIMPKGAILAFDELNHKLWPGETLAVQETVGIRNIRIERFPFQPQISFSVLE